MITHNTHNYQGIRERKWESEGGEKEDGGKGRYRRGSKYSCSWRKVLRSYQATLLTTGPPIQNMSPDEGVSSQLG